MTDQNITLNNQTYPVEFKYLPADSLVFFPQNPRFFDSLNRDDSVQSQDDIFRLLARSDAVLQLKSSILTNGGVVEPLYVVRSSNIVIEGNCRLAAFRLLAAENPQQWQQLPCWILPEDIGNDAVFALLGQHHISGRKDWDEFEQAHYLYRRVNETGVPCRILAAQLGIPPRRADKFIRTIEFMEKHGDVSQKHWKCYSQYLNNASVKKVRKSEPELDQTIADAIRSEEIKNNSEIRMLCDTAKIAARGDEIASDVIRDIADGSMNIRQGYNKVDTSGKFDDVLAKLQKFLNDINRSGFENKIADCGDSSELIRSEIDNIISRLQQFRSALECEK